MGDVFACGSFAGARRFREATRYAPRANRCFANDSRSFEFEGVPLAKHQKVLVLIGAAARSAAKWSIQMIRHHAACNAAQIGYGAAFHSCVAQMMARLGRIFFQYAGGGGTLEYDGARPAELQPGLRGLSRCRCG